MYRLMIAFAFAARRLHAPEIVDKMLCMKLKNDMADKRYNLSTPVYVDAVLLTRKDNGDNLGIIFQYFFVKTYVCCDPLIELSHRDSTNK